MFKSTDAAGHLEAAQHRPDQPPMFMPWRSTRRRRPRSMLGQGGGVYKSTTAAGWTGSEVNTGLTNTNVYAVAIDPLTPGTLYAGTMVAAFQEHEQRRESGRPPTPA